MKKTKSKVSQAFSILEGRIVSGFYNYGQVLSANALSKELDMSRTPILEAFKLLETQNFVSVIPQVGVVVKPLDLDYIQERIAARSLLEGYMAAQAAKKADEQMKQELKKINEKMEKCIHEKNTDEFAQLNIQFHEMIMQISSNRFVKELVLNLWDQNRYLNLSELLFSEKNKFLVIREHQQLVEAIISGDPVKARNIMENHVNRVLENFLFLIKSKSEDYEGSG